MIEKYINKIICGDNIETCKNISDNQIDLTVTSPPYDTARLYKGYDFKFEKLAQELYRITKIGGIIVWVVADEVINGSESGTSFKQALYFKEIGFNIHDTMIYKKSGMRYPNPLRYHSCFEYMFIFSKGIPQTVNLIKDRANKYSGAKIARKGSNRQKNGDLTENSAWRLDKERKIQPFGTRYNIWEYAVGKGNMTKDEIAYKHPAIFGEKLANDHILSWSNSGDLVLDCFNGSGTTIKMAKTNNRNFIGIDCSLEYCQIAQSRLKENFNENIEILNNG